MGNRLNLFGQRFGRLFIIEFAGVDKTNHSQWKAICDCGLTTIIRAINLKNQNTKSCGCLRRETCSKTGRKALIHGHVIGDHASPTYNSWVAMKIRCLNPKHKKYFCYGGRGIRICDRWMSFENFLTDMGERPSGLTLDRKDTNGNYEPDNCRWATWEEQCKNRRPRQIGA